MRAIAAALDPAERAAANKLVGDGAPAPHPDAEVVAAPATVVGPDGFPQLIAARYPSDALAEFRAAARAYPMDTTLRSVGIRNRSRVFGYGARNVVMQRNCCRESTGAEEAPAAHAGIVAAAPILAGLLAEARPEVAARDTAAAEAVRPDWRMAGTQWTSGVLNATSPLPYHYDRNNLEPVWSAMIVVRRGVRGGHLHVPELGVTVECRDGDVVLFPGWRYVHGVTPLTVRGRDAYRLSAVFYAVRGMRDCLEPEAELAWARADRTRREADLRPAAERLGGERRRAAPRRGGVANGWRGMGGDAGQKAGYDEARRVRD